jgi:hypothetical protein
MLFLLAMDSCIERVCRPATADEVPSKGKRLKGVADSALGYAGERPISDMTYELGALNRWATKRGKYPALGVPQDRPELVTTTTRDSAVPDISRLRDLGEGPSRAKFSW